MAAKALGIKKIEGNSALRKFKEKDLRVINMMRSENRYFTPTEIGMKLSKRKFSNDKNVTAWSLRTLYKLMEHGYVEKNDRGYYRWVQS